MIFVLFSVHVYIICVIATIPTFINAFNALSRELKTNLSFFFIASSPCPESTNAVPLDVPSVEFKGFVTPMLIDIRMSYNSVSYFRVFLAF